MSIREDFSHFWPNGGRTLAWIVGIAFVVGVVVENPQTVKSYALGLAILAAAVLDKTGWQVWVGFTALLVWGYTYRRNRQRQEKIISLLLEIYRKLE